MHINEKPLKLFFAVLHISMRLFNLSKRAPFCNCAIESFVEKISADLNTVVSEC